MDSPLAQVRLRLVDGIEDLLELKRWAGERRETPLGVDTETDGLDIGRHKVRLIQLGDLRTGWAVPFELWGGGALEVLRDYEGDLTGHNIPFDHRFIRKAGLSLPWHKVHDTLILGALDNPARPRGLKPLSSLLIDRQAGAGEQSLHDGMRENGWDWGTVPIRYTPYWVYGALDAVLTCHLWRQLHPRVMASCPGVYDLELGTARVVSRMMEAGLLIDRPYIQETITRLTEESEGIRTWLSLAHGISTPNSGPQVARALASLGCEVDAVTPTGLPRIDKEVLTEIGKSTSDHAVRDLVRAVFAVRHNERVISSYLSNFLEMADPAGVIRCQIWTLTAKTGRMCLAEGTMIDGPRDLVARPLGTPIQDVKPGDYVYSFDSSGTPAPRRVTALHSHGVKKVLRLVYARSGFHGGELMELKATPDHRIALRTGEYRELKDLKPGDKLGFMGRSVSGMRSSLEWNGGKRVPEPRVICNPRDNEVVHHKNTLTLDQRVENLESLTISKHIIEHGKLDACPFTDEQLSELVESCTNIRQLAKQLGYSDRVFRRWCRIRGVDIRDMPRSLKKRGHGDCPLTATEFFASLKRLSEGKRGGGEALARELGVPYGAVRRWKREFEASNHVVIAVVDDGERLPVYDLTIEETPNFVANELWVHNSVTEPALQTLHRDDKVVRGSFIPRPGCVFVTCDFSQIEMRLAAALSGDEGLIRAFKEADAGGIDFYSGIASEMFGEPVGKGDRRRQAVKTMSYAKLYGAGVATMARSIGLPASQVRPIHDSFNDRYPGLERLARGTAAQAWELVHRGEQPAITLASGRRLPVDREHAAVNYLIQGTAAEVLKRAGLNLEAEGLGREMRLFVHDEVLLEVPVSQAEEARRAVEAVMADTSSFAVPLTCEAKILPHRWVKQ